MEEIPNDLQVEALGCLQPRKTARPIMRCCPDQVQSQPITTPMRRALEASLEKAVERWHHTSSLVLATLIAFLKVLPSTSPWKADYTNLKRTTPS